VCAPKDSDHYTTSSFFSSSSSNEVSMRHSLFCAIDWKKKDQD
jgi:hypothetical protein